VIQVLNHPVIPEIFYRESDDRSSIQPIEDDVLGGGVLGGGVLGGDDGYPNSPKLAPLGGGVLGGDGSDDDHRES